MVLKKAIDYGFNGYRIPVIPKGPRSVRKRGSLKKAFEDSDICAFELLAAVAGKLLQESESSASSNADEGKDLSKIHGTGIKQEVLDEGKALSSECIDQASCIESGFIAELSQKRDLKSTFGEFPHCHDNTLGNASKVSSSNFNKNSGHDRKLHIAENQIKDINNSGKVEGASPESGETWDGVVDNNESKSWVQGDGKLIPKEETLAANTNRSRVPMETCVNTHPLVNSDSSVKMTSYRDSDPNIYFSRNSNNVKVVSRDDDDKFVGYNRSRSKIRAFRSQQRIGHRRIRKLLTSKYWKAAPKLKDYEFSNTDGGMKHHVSRCRKAPYSRERIQQEAPFKKRKLFDYCRTPAYDREGSSDSISNSPERGMKTEKNGSPMKSHRARGVYRSSVVDHQSSFQSNGSHVKFSIKSFKVPELYVEVPETATVGSLKRTVMEAVNAILRGGLRVGVVLHGQKVKEDNRTLLQAGISHDDNLDSLGFTLEPNSGISSPSISPRKPPVLLPCETQQQLSRLASSAVFDLGLSNAAAASSDPSPVANNVETHLEVNKELVPSSVELITTAGIAADYKALVPVPAMNVEALAVVPVNHHQKTKRCELAHRRTRRPFSVTEVEALVEAVEKLGTGRWRDVKLSAFENADHRTYVDLKDKWKTLVHTASISPQQRRGEPVPQELLDRVLAAHGYWTQHQSRQQQQHGGKHQADPPLNSTSDA